MAWFRKPNRTCEICGKSFYTAPSQVAKGNGRFCSKACMGRARDRRVNVACETCGLVFLINAYEVGRQRFCSPSCAMRSRSGERGPRWNGGEIEVRCDECGRVFSVKRYRQDEARFCSHRCKGDWMSRELIGENHHSWRGGWSARDYPGTFNDDFKERIRRRDSYTCLLCGAPGNQVHHIDYVKMNTYPDNCATLCASCHSKTNGNRAHWQALIQQIMRDRGY